ncbi:hypothetical protein CK203_093968 [Vitis vinifera]|uniref:Ubiquitin-like protease family profile domain-containing protein n=1 Tax=Vitis vinifera TaxID=29760 RepID=A0A438CKC7_VITVI|nr:hypothetical protein CK203_093968 [Vitis vinifera]
MATELRKRKEHVPTTCTQDKLPKSRCFGKKFITAIARLTLEKQQAIREMGFRSLLTFACRKLRYELCRWLISQYDFTYHRLNMGTIIVVSVNEEHVSKVMGIPSSELEGIHDLWDTIWDGDVGVQRNWAKFVLQYLEDGIREYRQNQPIYIRVKVEVTSPLVAAWSDDVIKRQLVAEISTFGGYGHVDAQEQPQSIPHMNVPLVASNPLASDDATEVLEAHVIETSKTMLRLASSLARDVVALHSRRSGSEGNSPTQAKASLPPQVIVEEAREYDGPCGSGSQALKPSSMRRFKRTGKRIVKCPPTCKSPFVAQCVKQFPKIPHVDRVVANYALEKIGDPSEILCEMYGMYITREEISCLNARRWINSVIVAIMVCILNGQQAPPAHAHYFDPSFSVVLSNLKANATSQVIMDRCRMYLDADIFSCDLGTCDMMFLFVCENNHWHIHIVNFPSRRVEILSSLPLRHGNNISASTR